MACGSQARVALDLVDLGEYYSNRRRAVEKLVASWDDGIHGFVDDSGEPDDPLICASTEPRERTRTPLTHSEVNAIRTARDAGASVTVLTRRYGVTRQTIWAKTLTRS